jgi:glycosyltransferase involved in cell wall biosynthesis
MNNNKIKVLYLAYDGMTDPLGQSQVLSYLKGLSLQGYSFDVIAYEKPDRYEKYQSEIKAFIEGYDINWIPLVYHKNPPIISTFLDINAGWKKIKELCQSTDYKLVHVRGYQLAGLGVKLKKNYGIPFLFDMRGWWADEKLESGVWKSFIYTPIYYYFKAEERAFFRAANNAISLTHIGKSAIADLGLKSEKMVDVIPTCVNFDVFKPFDAITKASVRTQLNIPQDATVLLYSGSVGANYRTDLVLKLFESLLKLKPNSYLFFLSHAEHQIIEDEVAKTSIDKSRIRIQSARYQEVSTYLMAGDIGVIMYNTGFSVIGRSPTKLGEYWASGLTAISAKGIGDLEAILNAYPDGGALVNSVENFDDYLEVMAKVVNMKTPTEKLRSYANEYFSLESGIQKYTHVYKKLISE